MNGRGWLMVGALIAGAAVGLGAAGAHWFPDQAAKLYADEEIRAKRIDNWAVGSQYQMYHGLALVAVGLASAARPSRWWDASAACFVLGVFLFSGSLYAIAASGVSEWRTVAPWGYILIAATPLGGMSFLLGWLWF